MSTKEHKKLLDEIHSKVIEYIYNSNIRPKRTIKEINADINLSIGPSADFKQIKILIEQYLEYSVKTNSSQFYNQLFSGISITGYIGELISTITNNSMYTFEMSPVATLIEIELIKKMSNLIGYKNGGGTFVPGGSNGNYLAMLSARQTMMPEIMKNGMFESKAIAAFVSNESHYSMIKAATQLGIGTNNIIRVDVDSSGRMDPIALRNAIKISINNGIKPFFVGATAGTTVRGCFDPIFEIAEICKENNIWLHIDGSWGGTALLSSKHRALIAGSEYSDSFTWCAHKGMAQPLMCTAILFKDTTILFNINNVEGTQYLFHGNDGIEPDLGRQSLQCGRRVDSLKLWLTWKYYGDKGYEKNINHIFDMAQYAKNKVLSSKNLRLISDVQFLNICFQIHPKGLEEKLVDEFTLQVRNRLYENGMAMVNYAEVEGKTCIRLVTVNYDLSTVHLDQFFTDIEQTSKEILPDFL